MEHTSDDPLVRKAGTTDEEESERLLQLSRSLSNESRNLSMESERFDRRASRFARFSGLGAFALATATKEESRLELQGKIERLSNDAQEAFRLHQKLHLPVLCRKLQRNDPSIQKIDGDVISHLPNGYAQQLCSALKGNTNVRFLLVELNHLEWRGRQQLSHEEFVRVAKPMLDFVETSPSLRIVELFSRRSTIYLSTAFFDAIASSSSIEELRYSGSSLKQAVEKCPHFLGRKGTPRQFQLAQCKSRTKATA
jgi:hypothetical protein